MNDRTVSLQARRSNRRVRLQVQGTDRYARVMPVIYSEGQHVNRWMVRHGHASEHDKHEPYPPFDRRAASHEPPTHNLGPRAALTPR